MLVLPLFTVCVWAGEKDSNTLRVDAFFSEKGRKNLRVQKYLDTRERGLRVASLCISFHGPPTSKCRQTEIKPLDPIKMEIGWQKSVVMGTSMLAYTSQ